MSNNFELRTHIVMEGILIDRLAYAIVFNTQKDRQEFIEKRLDINVKLVEALEKLLQSLNDSLNYTPPKIEEAEAFALEVLAMCKRHIEQVKGKV